MTSHHRSPPISEDSTIISLSAATGLFSWRLRENKTGISHDLTDKLCFLHKHMFLHKTNTICETKSLRTGKWPSRNS